MEVQHKFDGGYIGMTENMLLPGLQDLLHKNLGWLFANQIEKHTVKETILDLKMIARWRLVNSGQNALQVAHMLSSKTLVLVNPMYTHPLVSFPSISGIAKFNVGSCWITWLPKKIEHSQAFLKAHPPHPPHHFCIQKSPQLWQLSSLDSTRTAASRSTGQLTMPQCQEIKI